MAMPPNLHSLYMGGMYPLGVECRECGRKAQVPADRFGGCKGDMTELRSLRLVRQSCGSREPATKVFLSAGEAEARGLAADQRHHAAVSAAGRLPTVNRRWQEPTQHACTLGKVTSSLLPGWPVAPTLFGRPDGRKPLEREQRRLAAILFADAVGSSLLMGRDESGIVARLLQHLNQRLAPAVGRHGGRVIRPKGDGALVEFISAVDALAAAVEFQQAMTEANRGQPDHQAIMFRIGLHLGDVIVEGDDIYGDAVNVAARLEAEAPAGGILVSRALREAVTGRLKVSLHVLGELALKNIERPIRAFRAEWTAEVGLCTLLRQRRQWSLHQHWRFPNSRRSRCSRSRT